MRHESMAARRIIRASRMLAEQGHDGDALGALYEMVELRRERDELLEALRTACDHIDMAALEISHCKDAERIRAAVAMEGGAA